MNTRPRSAGVLAGLLTLTLLVAVGTAQGAPTLLPECGAAGDAVLIRGEGFAEIPVVRFGGFDAEVLRSCDDRILCLVPEGTSLGALGVTVDGTAAATDFTVLEEGSPVVIRVSSDTVTPGMRMFVFGRRLGGGEVRFLDATDTSVATVEPKGRFRALVFAIPEDLDPGTYTMAIENGDGLDTGDCSPTIEVVEAGDATLDGIEPDGAAPGDPITLTGTDLSPAWPVRIVWTDAAGKDRWAFGFSNGYDEVRSRVPHWANAGETYDVAIELRDGSWVRTNSVAYTVGTPGGPVIEELAPEAAPAGSVLRIRGTNLFRRGAKPVVELTLGTTTLEARVFWTRPGFGPHAEEITCLVPDDAEDGTYDVTVTVGDQTSDAVAFEVGEQDLTVDSLSPASVGKRGGWRPVLIEGTGFGAPKTVEIEVTWDDGGSGEPLPGRILFRTDDRLVVLPPGDFRDPLPSGTYTIRVTRDPDGTPETVVAGTYTVR